jgi:hypothetical protein
MTQITSELNFSPPDTGLVSSNDTDAIVQAIDGYDKELRLINDKVEYSFMTQGAVNVAFLTNFRG